MSFATPLAFALAALAVPIVIFYILKVRLRRVPVSTNLFWKQLYDEKPPRSIWQYLRHLLSLLAQLLVLALLLLAVADPYLPWQLLQARRIVMVIDNSASMRATDISPSRFSAAIDAALATTEGLRFRDEMAIVLAGLEPTVVVGMSGHVPTLKRALRSIELSDNPTNLAGAMELGQQLVGKHPHGQVLVFTDTSPASSPPQSCDLRIFGTPDAGNVGITQFQVRRSLIDPLGYQVLVTVRNASARAIQGRLEVELDEIPVDVLPLKLDPEGVFTRALEKTSLEGGQLVARLTDLSTMTATEAAAGGAGQSGSEPDEAGSTERELNLLPTDDEAWAILPPREVQEVLLVTPGNLFLQKVLEANPLVRVTVAKQLPATLPAGAAIVLHRQVPMQLPPGDLFVVDPIDSCDLWEVGEQISNPIVTEQDKSSSLMTHVRLDNVIMPEARQLKFAQSPQVLAGTVSGDAVYAELKRAGGKCLVLSVNINEGDLAFRTAFPIMVTNALGWFAGQSGELRPSVATGSLNKIALSDERLTSGSRVALRSPSGADLPLVLQSSSELSAVTSADGRSNDSPSAAPGGESGWRVSLPPLAQCGVWELLLAGSEVASETESPSPLARIAVNLASERETDLRSPQEPVGGRTPALAGGWFSRPIWFYLAVLAGVLSVTEWWLYQRRFLA